MRVSQKKLNHILSNTVLFRAFAGLSRNNGVASKVSHINLLANQIYVGSIVWLLAYLCIK